MTDPAPTDAQNARVQTRAPAAANRRVALIAAGIVCAMLGVVAYSPTLYALFCQVTGFSGTTQEAAAAPDAADIRDVWITVRFDASKGRMMPWRFRANQSAIRVRPGEQAIAYYTAHNPTDRPVAGTATYNVAPFKVGGHFFKIECFCFQEQLLAPGETVEMPVIFYVNPSLLDDPESQDVREITLSYTFFEQEIDEDEVAAAPSPSPQEPNARLALARASAALTYSQ